MLFSFCYFRQLIGMGPAGYAQDRFNLFDCSIVLISVMESVIKWAQVDSGVTSGGAISAFRGVRLLRVFKLARSWKSFQDMLIKIGHTLKDISNFSVLLFLFMFTYTLLGMELYAYNVKFNENNEVDAGGHSPRANFDTFLEAFTTIFIVLIGEDWNTVMYDHIRAMGYVGIIFFVSLVIFGNFILLNLFLAILLKNFEEEEKPEKSSEEKDEESPKKNVFNKLKSALQNRIGKLMKNIKSKKEASLVASDGPSKGSIALKKIDDELERNGPDFPERPRRRTVEKSRSEQSREFSKKSSFYVPTGEQKIWGSDSLHKEPQTPSHEVDRTSSFHKSRDPLLQKFERKPGEEREDIMHCVEEKLYEEEVGVGAVGSASRL